MQIELARMEGTRGQFAHEYRPDELVIDDDRVHLAGPARVSGTISRAGNRLKLEGQLDARAEIDCDRCLQTIELPIQTEFQLEYVTPEQYASTPNAELSEEELDLSVFDGEVVDVDQMVQEQLLLAAPSQVLCQESCKGLCSECGANLNAGDCGCSKSEVDPRWAALKKIVNGES